MYVPSKFDTANLFPFEFKQIFCIDGKSIFIEYSKSDNKLYIEIISIFFDFN